MLVCVCILMPLFSSERRLGAADTNDALRSRASRGTGGGQHPRGGGSSTLLPLSYTTHLPNNNTTTNNKDHQPFSNARKSPRNQHHYHQYDDMPTPTCNNFLLGGNYFPGKDKRRKHMRKKKKSFIERLSPVRLGIITVILLYVLRYWVFSSSRRIQPDQQRQADGWWWTPLATMHLKDRAQTQAEAKRLQKAVNALSDTNKHLRHAIYEKLSPEWYHRNDVPKNRRNDNPPQGQAEGNTDKHQKFTEPKEETRKERKASHTENLNEGQIQAKKQKTEDRPQKMEANKAPVEKKIEGKKEQAPPTLIPRRTLRTMERFAGRTSCPRNLSEAEIVTTLVVQSSLNRSWVLEETCKRWKDPIVAVITLHRAESNLEMSTFLQEWKVKCPEMFIVIHEMDPEQEDPAMYPVNHLRNLGLDQVKTSHILIVDVDFVPSDGMAEAIRKAVKLRQEIRDNVPDAIVPSNLEAIVVPAFQRNTDTPCLSEEECKGFLQHDSFFIPHDFDHLRDCVKNELCTVFQYLDNWEGHHSTRSERWLARDWYEEESIPGTDLKDLKQIPCFDSLRYEPYVVIQWCPVNQKSPVVSAPFYDERFHGYGKNKIEYIQHLRFMGYKFSVLPEGFITHNPHPPSKAKEVWNDRNKHSLHKDMDALYPEFLSELLEKFKDTLDKAIGQCR